MAERIDMTDSVETKRQKAREMSYRKAIVKDVNFETIRNDLYDIMEACDDVRYYCETDDDTLINALNGDEDEASEFKMMFADLCGECEQMQNDLEDYEDYGAQDYFDDFFVAIGQGEDMLGYDTYEGDYFGLDDTFTENLARRESKKRIMRMTKDQIIDAAHTCFRLFRSYIGLRYRYDCLKSAMDILRDENTAQLEVVKKIEEIYDRADLEIGWDGKIHSKELDRLLDCMPDEAWVQ